MWRCLSGLSLCRHRSPIAKQRRAVLDAHKPLNIEPADVRDPSMLPRPSAGTAIVLSPETLNELRAAFAALTTEEEREAARQELRRYGIDPELTNPAVRTADFERSVAELNSGQGTPAQQPSSQFGWVQRRHSAVAPWREATSLSILNYERRSRLASQTDEGSKPVLDMGASFRERPRKEASAASMSQRVQGTGDDPAAAINARVSSCCCCACWGGGDMESAFVSPFAAPFPPLQKRSHIAFESASLASSISEADVAAAAVAAIASVASGDVTPVDPATPRGSAPLARRLSIQTISLDRRNSMSELPPEELGVPLGVALSRSQRGSAVDQGSKAGQGSFAQLQRAGRSRLGNSTSTRSNKAALLDQLNE